jgi:hypothetical protein
MVRLQHNTGFATRIRKRKVQPVASRTRLSMFASTSPLSCQSVLRFILDYAKSALCTSRVCRRTALTRQYIGHSSLSAAGDHQTLWNVFGSGSQQAVGKGKTSRCCTGGCSVPTLVRQLDAGRAARQTSPDWRFAQHHSWSALAKLRTPYRAMSTPFQFIDNSTLGDRRSRRAIRSHVMKGKNVGKVRKPRVCLAVPRAMHTAVAAASSTETSTIAPILGHGQQEAVFRQAKMHPEILIRVGHDFSGLKIPGNITPRGRHFISACWCLYAYPIT